MSVLDLCWNFTFSTTKRRIFQGLQVEKSALGDQTTYERIVDGG
jgi:hypothetical protein